MKDSKYHVDANVEILVKGGFFSQHLLEYKEKCMGCTFRLTFGHHQAKCTGYVEVLNYSKAFVLNLKVHDLLLPAHFR